MLLQGLCPPGPTLTASLLMVGMILSPASHHRSATSHTIRMMHKLAKLVAKHKPNTELTLYVIVIGNVGNAHNGGNTEMLIERLFVFPQIDAVYTLESAAFSLVTIETELKCSNCAELSTTFNSAQLN